MKNRLLIDIDDVSAMFRYRFMQLVNEIHGTNLRYENCQGYWEVSKAMGLTERQAAPVWRAVNSNGFAQTLEPMPGVQEAVERLAQHYEVMFVTKPLRSSPTWVYDRTHWVKKHFGVALSKNIHSTGAKYAVDGNVLIEDTPSHAVAWLADRIEHSRRNCYAVLYAWPYNEDQGQHSFPRFPDWPAITNHIGY